MKKTLGRHKKKHENTKSNEKTLDLVRSTTRGGI